MKPAELLCRVCSRRIFEKDRAIRRCDVFLDGIPAEILSGVMEHLQPYPGDNGIIFSDLRRFGDFFIEGKLVTPK